MAKLETIIFHIGPHKTGTTFLQHQLMHSREALLAAGVAVPADVTQNPTWDRNHSYLMMKLAGRPAGGGMKPEEYEAMDADGLFRVWLADQTAPTLLISAEKMSHFNAENWSRIRDFFTPHMDSRTQVRCISFARHPLTRALSLRNQLAKSGQHWSPGKMLSADSAFQDGLKAFQEVWGAEASVEVCRYEEVKERGIWPEFLRIIGLNPAGFPPKVLIDRGVNRSVSLEMRWIFEACGAVSDVGKRRWRRSKWHFKSGTKDGFTASEAAEIWAAAGEQVNGWLVERGLPTYVNDVEPVDLGSAALWPAAFVAEWRAALERAGDEERAYFLATFQRLRQSDLAAAWHPEARERFSSLLSFAEGLVAEDLPEDLVERRVQEASPRHSWWRSVWRKVVERY